MNTSERRKEILKTLRSSDFPVAARELAAKFGVSRQGIVQDMAGVNARNPFHYKGLYHTAGKQLYKRI